MTDENRTGNEVQMQVRLEDPLVLRAESIEDAIESAGLRYCSNKMVQVLGGSYYYVKALTIEETDDPGNGWTKYTEINETWFDDDDNVLEAPRQYAVFYKYKIYEVPIEIVYLLINAMFKDRKTK